MQRPKVCMIPDRQFSMVIYPLDWNTESVLTKTVREGNSSDTLNPASVLLRLTRSLDTRRGCHLSMTLRTVAGTRCEDATFQILICMLPETKVIL